MCTACCRLQWVCVTVHTHQPRLAAWSTTAAATTQAQAQIVGQQTPAAAAAGCRSHRLAGTPAAPAVAAAVGLAAHAHAAAAAAARHAPVSPAAGCGAAELDPGWLSQRRVQQVAPAALVPWQLLLLQAGLPAAAGPEAKC